MPLAAVVQSSTLVLHGGESRGGGKGGAERWYRRGGSGVGAGVVQKGGQGGHTGATYVEHKGWHMGATEDARGAVCSRGGGKDGGEGEQVWGWQ